MSKINDVRLMSCQSLFFTLVVLILFGIDGCAWLEKEPGSMAKIGPNQIRLADDINLSRDGWPEARWWHRYHDEQLNALVEQAINTAPTLAVASSRIRASEAQSALIDAQRGLSVNFSASVDRTDLSHNGFAGPFAQNIPSEGLTGPWYTAGTFGFDADYTFDVWGKSRAMLESAIGVRNARMAEAAQTELVLATRVTQIYFDIESLHVSLSLLQQARDIDSELLAAHAARYAHGIESQSPTEISRVNGLEMDKQIDLAKSRIVLMRETLRALVGAGPDDLPEIRAVTLPADVGALPPTIDYQLLARRPDLQASRWYVEASMRQIDVAKASFYPSFNIMAFLGQDSLHLDELLHRSSRQLSLVPGLTLPIFDSGRLNADLANAHAESDLLIANYNQSVLDAVRDVAQVAIELKDAAQQINFQQKKINALMFTLASTEAHFSSGLTDKVVTLEARLPVLAAEGQMNELRNRQINNDVALNMVLGGGYGVQPNNVLRTLANIIVGR